MKLQELEVFIENLFPTSSKTDYKIQSGFTNKIVREIKRIGYCTNLTVETTEKAAKEKVDLLLTHHDAWDFLYGMKEKCQENLKKYEIAHYFNHLPLDDCDFGTNASLLKALGLTEINKTHFFEGYFCGRIAKPNEPLSFDELVKNLELTLNEPVRSWKFIEKPVEKVGLVCGGGGATADVKEAVHNNCDTYITSERNLYTLQYARLARINLIIGSHTGTELFGIENLSNLIKASYEIETVRIIEDYIEH